MTSVEVRSMRKSAALRRRGPGKLQAARSMPFDRYSAAVNGVGHRAPLVAEEGDELKEWEVVGAEGDADSPYSSSAATAEEEEGGEKDGGGDEVQSAAAATPSPSQGDSSWGDTSSYGAKKVGSSFSDAFQL
jgi:myosin V